MPRAKSPGNSSQNVLPTIPIGKILGWMLLKSVLKVAAKRRLKKTCDRRQVGFRINKIEMFDSRGKEPIQTRFVKHNGTYFPVTGFTLAGPAWQSHEF